jgi:endonuclease YncB( thermonuclease family)
VKYADLFVQLQRDARENKKGLWGMPKLKITVDF